MSDFWIKVEKSTPDKPEIFEIAEILGIDPDAVVGKLIRVWSWVDSNSENGHVSSVTNVLVDRMTMSQGFADAMKSVGWLDEKNIPNFSRHLGKSAKKRANDAERKRKSRTSSEECHKESVTEVGLDKSRVDKKENKAESKIPSCMHSEIVALYNQTFPELTQVMVALWNGPRKTRLNTIWKSSQSFQTMEFWQWYFSSIRMCSKWEFFSGANDRGWKADIEYMLRSSVFPKLIEQLNQEASC